MKYILQYKCTKDTTYVLENVAKIITVVSHTKIIQENERLFYLHIQEVNHL